MDDLPDVAPGMADESALLDWLAMMRAEQPVWRDRRGVWHVFGHADVSEVLRDPAGYSSDLSPIFGGIGPAPGMITQTDPPDHRVLRKAVGSAFTSRTIDDLGPRIRRLTRDLLDRTGERFDLVEALARPLPITIIGELLGLPPADHGRFQLDTDVLFEASAGDPSAPETAQQLMTAILPLAEYLGHQCQRRRSDPGDDLISALVGAEVDGHSLDDQQVVGLSIAVLLAGHPSTAIGLANIVRTLDEHPRHWANLHRGPSSVPAVVEEVLRYRPPFGWVQRVTGTEMHLGGATIPAGEMVVPWMISASRDPRVHPDPDRFDPGRAVRGPDRLHFGHGIHVCLGAALARLESRVVLEELLRRWDHLAVERDPQQPHGGLGPYDHVVLGTRRLPVRAIGHE